MTLQHFILGMYAKYCRKASKFWRHVPRLNFSKRCFKPKWIWDVLSDSMVRINWGNHESGNYIYLLWLKVTCYFKHSHLKTTAMDEISDIALRKNLKSMTKKIPSELKNLVELSKSWGDEVRQNSFSQSIGSGGPPSRSNSSGKLRNLADKGIFRFKY